MYLVQVREEVGVIPPKEVRPGDIVPVRHCPVEEAVFLGRGVEPPTEDQGRRTMQKKRQKCRIRMTTGNPRVLEKGEKPELLAPKSPFIA